MVVDVEYSSDVEDCGFGVIVVGAVAFLAGMVVAVVDGIVVGFVDVVGAVAFLVGMIGADHNGDGVDAGLRGLMVVSYCLASCSRSCFSFSSLAARSFTLVLFTWMLPRITRNTRAGMLVIEYFMVVVGCRLLSS